MNHTHLTDADRDRAALYALDALEADETRDFEHHLQQGCRACRAEVDALARAAGDLAYAAPPVAPPARVRERLLAAIESPRDDGFSFIRAHEGAWREVAPGVHRKDLTPAPNGSVFLIRLDPGAVVPTHDHAHVEHCYVVEGDAEAAGVRLVAGDHHVAGRGTRHEGLTTAGGCLLLLVAESHA